MIHINPPASGQAFELTDTYHQAVQTAWEEDLRSTGDVGAAVPRFVGRESSGGTARPCSQHWGWTGVLELLHLVRIVLDTWQTFLTEKKSETICQFDTEENL